MKNTVAIALRVLGMLLGLTWVCGALANMAFPEAYVCSPGNNCPSPPSLLERAASNALFLFAGGLLLVPQSQCRPPMARQVYGLLLTGFSLFLAAFWLRQLGPLLFGDFWLSLHHFGQLVGVLLALETKRTVHAELLHPC